MRRFKYKILHLPPPLTSIDVINDWQSDNESQFETTTDITEVLSYPFKIAAIPAMFNVEGNFAYNKALADVDWSQFDLVVISEIENYSFDDIKEKCIVPAGITNYLLSMGSFEYNLPPNVVYRPWWIFRHLEINASKKLKYEENYNKPFKFDALLGQGRSHRHYVMSRFQKNPSLLNESIVMYRGLFGEGDTDTNTIKQQLMDEIKQVLDGEEMLYPYESPNLNPEWEVSSDLTRSISERTPWEIYKQTYYSIVCETNYYNPMINPDNTEEDSPGPFFITEKIAKAILGKRLFVMFGPMHILKFFKEQGFKTFENIIDESYDSSTNICERFTKAFDQVEHLYSLDSKKVLMSTSEIREHNFNHLYRYRNITKNKMQNLIFEQIPDEYLIEDSSFLPGLKDDEMIRINWQKY